jgi:hypothetical protein
LALEAFALGISNGMGKIRNPKEIRNPNGTAKQWQNASFCASSQTLPENASYPTGGWLFGVRFKVGDVQKNYCGWISIRDDRPSTSQSQRDCIIQPRRCREERAATLGKRICKSLP